LGLKRIMFNDATNRQKKNEIGFSLQTCVYEVILSKYLIGIKTEDVNFLMVYCVGNIKETIVDSYTIENGLTIRIPYNPVHFLNCNTVEEKYQEYHRVMDEFIFPVFEEKGWDYNPVRKALNKIKEHNFFLEFLLKGTPKKSPDKNHTAFVFAFHTNTSFRLVAKIYSKEGLLVKEKVLVEEAPIDLAYRRFLGKPDWKDNNTFEVSSKISQWVGSITI
jgi:hypothetical protein